MMNYYIFRFWLQFKYGFLCVLAKTITHCTFNDTQLNLRETVQMLQDENEIINDKNTE